MTDMIARDLQDMHDHPGRTMLAAILTLLIMFGCAFGCLFVILSTIGAIL